MGWADEELELADLFGQPRFAKPGIVFDKPRSIMKEQAMRIPRPILWSSKDGELVVVEGPFPYGFIRSLDAGTVLAAVNRSIHSEQGELVARGETTKSGRYAKTLKQYIQEVENEWGPVGY